MYWRIVRRFNIRSPTAFLDVYIRQISEYSKKEIIIKSSLPDIEIPNLTTTEFIFEKWSKFPNRTAMECCVTGKKYTFEELRRSSINLCGSLRKKLHLQIHDVVAILLPNSPDFGICLLGALQAGLIVTTITPSYSIEEISRHLRETDVKAVFTTPLLVSSVQSYSREIPIIAVKLKSTDSLPQGAIAFNELIDEKQEEFTSHIDINDVALMPSSSGTTGFPKAVELTHKNIVAQILQFNNPYVSQLLTSTEDYQAVVPGTLPFFHVAGLFPILLTCLWNMSHVVILPKFQPDTYIELLAKHRPHYMAVVPYLVGFISKNPSISQAYLQRLKMIGSSTAPLSAHDEDMLRAKVGSHVDVLQAYGMTEMTALVTIGDPKDSTAGSSGKPLQSTSIMVIDENGQSLGPNQPGEILVKGPQLMRGYHRKPEQTKETLLNGWLRSGDVGYYNENNLLYITDRIKDLIKVKGFQVAPAELEAVIRKHPNVLEVAVIGIPHGTFGEVPKAYVVLKENERLRSKDLQDFVAGKVANYKQLLGGVEFVNELPKGASGKILRKQLRTNHKVASER